MQSYSSFFSKRLCPIERDTQTQGYQTEHSDGQREVGGRRGGGGGRPRNEITVAWKVVCQTDKCYAFNGWADIYDHKAIAIKVWSTVPRMEPRCNTLTVVVLDLLPMRHVWLWIVPWSSSNLFFAGKYWSHEVPWRKTILNKSNRPHGSILGLLCQEQKVQKWTKNAEKWSSYVRYSFAKWSDD